MHDIEKAIFIATKAHQGQVDKGGNPYILHPLAVMLRVKSLEAKIVAVLHDVVEDSEISIEQLQKEGFSLSILDALFAVTRKENETYDDFLERISLNKLATEVKLADLEENMNLSRIPNPTNQDYKRIQKYQLAVAKLKET